MRSYIKVMVPEAMLKAFSKPGQYDAPHAIAVMVAETIKQGHFSKIGEVAPHISLLIESLIDSVERARLSDEQISKLPKQVVMAQLQFQAYCDQLAGIMKLWVRSISKNNFAWVTHANLHEQWLLMTKIATTAGDARTRMIKAGVASLDDARQVLEAQSKIYQDIFRSQLVHKPRLAMAQANFAEQNAAAAPTT